MKLRTGRSAWSREVPGLSAWNRFARRPAAALGVLITALAAFTASQVHSHAQIQLTADVNANWRGAYDILVRPQQRLPDAAVTDGLVEPNFLTFAGTGGITADQLQTIRRIDGVELAAPVSVVGYVRTATSAPTLHVSSLPALPTLYRVHVTASTSDGVSTIVVQQSTARILLHRADLRSTSLIFPSDRLSTTWDQSGVDFALPELPELVTPLIGVDPQSERELLGTSAGFLTPLIRYEEASKGQGFTVGDVPYSLIPNEFAAAETQIDSMRGQPQTANRPVVPVVVSSRIYAPLTLTLDVEQLGRPLSAFSPNASMDQLQVQAGPGSRTLGRTTEDVTGHLQPYVTPALSLTWPGSQPAVGQSYAWSSPPKFDTRLAGRPSYAMYRNGSSIGPSFKVAARGAVLSDGSPPTGAADPASTRVQSYRDFTEQPLPGVEGFTAQGPGDAPYAFAPLGTFDLSRLALPTNALDYVPLGAYDPPDTRLVASPTGAAVSPTRLTTGLNPVGLVQQPPLAITDLDSAAMLRGRAPIDAIRVRVSDLHGFSTAARQRVERVASQIAALGLHVDIVVGSSPQSVSLFVPQYFIAADGTTRDLGWVTQEWTTLGAAQQVTAALGTATSQLLLVGLAAILLLATVTQAMGVESRRRELSTLRDLGWTRPMIWRWFAAESVPAGLVVLTAALLGAVRAGASVGVLAAVGCALAIPAATAVTAWSLMGAANKAPATHRTRWHPLVRHPRAYALRSVISRPGRSLLMVTVLIVAGLALSTGLVLIDVAGGSAGRTLIALHETAGLAPAQYGLVGVVGIAALAVVALLLRLNRYATDQEDAALVSAGWRPSQVRRVHLWRNATWLLAAAAGAALTSTADPLSAVQGWTVRTLMVVACCLAVLGAAMCAEAGLHRKDSN